MANSWMRLERQASEFSLPEALSRRDPFAARDCGWVEQMRPLIAEFSRPGERVLDPFSGFGSTLVAAGLEGRESVGIEIEASRHALTCERLEVQGISQAKVLLGDSEVLADKLDPVDLVLTSLPYFGCGFSSDKSGQLYDAESYGAFLEKVRTTLQALKRALKPGGYLVVAVENIRIGDHFIPQAWDVARLIMARFAFIEERIIVYDKPEEASSSPLSNRAHEYVLIARNGSTTCDLDGALAELQALQAQFPDALLIGSFARWLEGEVRNPSDVDLLLPDNPVLARDVVGWLEARAFQITRWGAPVAADMTSLASENARYFRSERMDSEGSRVVMDLNFAPSQAFYMQQRALARDINGVLCITERVNLD